MIDDHMTMEDQKKQNKTPEPLEDAQRGWRRNFSLKFLLLVIGRRLSKVPSRRWRTGERWGFRGPHFPSQNPRIRSTGVHVGPRLRDLIHMTVVHTHTHTQTHMSTGS